MTVSQHSHRRNQQEPVHLPPRNRQRRFRKSVESGEEENERVLRHEGDEQDADHHQVISQLSNQ